MPNIDKLRLLARLQGVSLKDYTDREIVQIIHDAAQIALDTSREFVFKPTYTM